MMRQINLLPSDIAERRRARQMTLLLAAGLLGLVALLVLVFVLQAARLSGARGDLEAQERANSRLERQVDQLQGFAQLQATLRTKEQLLGQLTVNEVRWSLLLNNISLVIPSDVWLTNFSGSVQAAAAAPGAATGPVGTIQVSGQTFTHLDVARWLSRLAGVDEFLFPYLSLSSKSDSDTLQTLVDFNSSVQLDQDALRRNQPGGMRQP
ncbi:MAG: PilN domain-containing protein [Actinomycetota bacterium]